MLPLMETIAVEKGVLQNLFYHQQRYQQTLSAFYPNQPIEILDLASICVPSEFQQGLVRCRVEYNNTRQQVRFFPYQRRQISTFKPVIANDLDYSLKFCDRGRLDQLYKQRGDCDEVMIIKHGLMTDCTIGNLIFLQEGIWYTPEKPLLYGTQRAKLLAEQRIQVREIRLNDLPDYSEIRLINALNPL